MGDMKTKIETKRQILFMLTDWNSIVTIDKFFEFVEQEYSETLRAELKIEFVKKCMEELFENKLITSISMRSEFDSEGGYKLTSKGEEFAEKIRCEDRWNQVLCISSKLEDFSERTVMNVYEQIIQRDISKLVNEDNALTNLTTAMYDLTREIAEYNSRHIFG